MKKITSVPGLETLAPLFLLGSLLLGAMLAAGCGGGDRIADQSKAPAAAADPSASPLNEGPKAAATIQVNPGLADFGAKAFEKRACGTCHAIGERKQGPDLTGVAYRRTEAWMTKQILDPEWMVKNDPLARKLMAEYALQMANQHVPEQEVKAILHYLTRETLKNPETASAGR